MSKYARKKDGNHNAISKFLSDHGCQVLDTSGIGKWPDLLVWRKGDVCFIECKLEGSQAKYTKDQLAFISMTKFHVAIAHTPDEAMQALSQKRFLSQKAKDMIAAMLAIKPKDVYTPAELQKVWDK